MRIIKFIIITLISINTFGQTKPIIFYNENQEVISKEKFLKTKDYRKNLDLYFENDTTHIGLLVTRQKFGKLDDKSFNDLKSYLTEISAVQIDSTQNIVINYLAAFPDEEENSTSRSKWDVLDNNYLKNLHKIAEIKQFWIHSPEVGNLDYYHKNRIDWIPDKENLIKKLFFPLEVRYGYYILIKPDGRFYYYLGEHSKYEIWEKSKKYFK